MQQPKPSVEQLGVDLSTLAWRRSGTGGTTGAGEGATAGAAIEVAFCDDWVLMRTPGDPGGPVLVFSRFEWECFLDGAKKGEFDDGAA